MVGGVSRRLLVHRKGASAAAPRPPAVCALLRAVCALLRAVARCCALLRAVARCLRAVARCLRAVCALLRAAARALPSIAGEGTGVSRCPDSKQPPPPPPPTHTHTPPRGAGATRAFPPHHPLIPVDYQFTGQPVLIGGTMGTCSYVLTGTDKGFEETFGSTCHGAGRARSRNNARCVFAPSFSQCSRRLSEPRRARLPPSTPPLAPARTNAA